MRFLLVALALVACEHPVAQRAPGSPPLANTAPAPDYRGAATDELAFLAVDADLIIGTNFIEVRRSQLWHGFKPQIDVLTKRMQQELAGACGGNLTDSVEGITMSLKLLDRDRVSAVVVMHGAQMQRTLDCAFDERRRKGDRVTVDRGVTLTQTASPQGGTASMVLGDSTLVMQIDPAATHDTLVQILERGAPLRTSSTFMRMYNRREHGAAVWGMANGEGKVFNAFGKLKPRNVDGTIVVTDRVKIAVRVAMRDATEAAQLQQEVDQVKPRLASFVDKFETQTTNELVTIDIEITDAQLRALGAMLGGAFGP